MRHTHIAVLALTLTMAAHAQKPDPIPAADPARPTLSVPAVLPPSGYLQFEQGFNHAVTSPSGTTAQSAINQAIKIALTSRILVQVLSQPFTYNTVYTPTSGPAPASTIDTENLGDIDLGTQLVLLKSTGTRPTIDIGYVGRVHTGTAANLDAGDLQQSLVLYLSGDLQHGFHYDSDYQFNLQRSPENQSSTSYSPASLVRRAQYAQTLSISHPIFPKSTAGRLSLDVELQHLTQPFVTATAHNGPGPQRANAVDLLLATAFALRPNLVFDAAITHGLTSTSTQWQGTFGLTWLVPHRLWPAHATTGAIP